MSFPNVVDFNAKIEWKYKAFLARTQKEILRQLDNGWWRVRVDLRENYLDFPNLEARLLKDVNAFMSGGACGVSALFVADKVLCIDMAVETFPPPDEAE